MKLLPAEKFPDHGHFESERQGQTGYLNTCLNYAADDGQIDRRQQEVRRVVDESGRAEINQLAPLSDYDYALLVSH